MKVTFKHRGAELASSRYRAIIPQRFFQVGRDVLVYGKHWAVDTQGFKKLVFDVCDDHLSHPEHGQTYRERIASADLVTCNSQVMRKVIKIETGRDAVVIPDPYEQPEKPARVHDCLLWFGHRSNIPDLLPWLALLPHVHVVSNADVSGVTTWTPEAMNSAFEAAGLVVIPTGKSMCKSGNRAIESLRRGLFPICGPLPAYADLGVWVGDIADGVRWALSHQDEVMRRIKSAQGYIREEYGPERIGGLWKEALSKL